MSRATFKDSQMTHVAGIGASAGGLEALLSLFSAVKPNGKLSYVVAQHMARNGHDELVVRLLQRESTLPVLLAADGMALQPDTVYVIPSGKDGRVGSHSLALSDPAPHHVSTPSANTLFGSIAASRKNKGMGIVLSGTGVDGMQGCRDIKAAGGLTWAQQPDEANFDGMPLAAINAHSIDQILPVKGMAEALAIRYPSTPTFAPLVNTANNSSIRTVKPTAPHVLTAPVDPALTELHGLLKQIHTFTGIDFSSYKEDTLLRRLSKRKEQLNMAGMAAYQAHIQREPTELRVLQRMFLVSVSSFFRDAESFAVLRQALTKHLASKPKGEMFRAWVPGCASGEEAYTLAIMLRELLAGQTGMPLHITGTDLNPEAVEAAQQGLFRRTAFSEMAPSLLQRYFTQHGDQWKTSKDLRSDIAFECRDVQSRPPDVNAEPFDLVSCRNLLIYMKTDLQDRLINRFHQVLKANGLLFIGQSESLSVVGNCLFAPLNPQHRLFIKRP